MLGLIRDPNPSHPAVADLRRRMDGFYATATGYTVFEKSQNRDRLYDLLAPRVRDAAAGGRPARVLELGAGRTEFPDYLRRAGLSVAFTAQDVTPKNRDYLASVCEAVVIGDVSDVPGEFDLVLSTYVLEHVASPRSFLEEIDRRLAPGGVHVVVCPRYDLPGYVCPSLRHAGRLRRMAYTAALTASRVRSALDRRPRFWVNPDPAMFHRPWYRDADAVHLVSQFDVTSWHRSRGYEVRHLRPPAGRWVDQIRQRLLTVSLACRKPG